MEPAAARQRRTSRSLLPPAASPLDVQHSRSAIPHPRRLPDRAFSLLVSTQPVELLWVPFGHRELLFDLMRARRSLPGMPVRFDMPKGAGGSASMPLVAPATDEEAAAESPVTRAGDEEAVAASPVARVGREEAAVSSLIPPMGLGEDAPGSPVEPTDADVERYDVLMHSVEDFGQVWPKAPPTSPSSVPSASRTAEKPPTGGGGNSSKMQ